MLALLVAALGLFLVIALLSVFVLRHTVGAAAIQSVSVTYSNASFAGIPILAPLFGPSSLLAIATAALMFNTTLVPLTVTMLEYDRQRTATGGEKPSVTTLLGRTIWDSFKRPYVWGRCSRRFSCCLMCEFQWRLTTMRYKVYEAEAASTFLLTTLSMVVVVPIAITLTR